MEGGETVRLDLDLLFFSIRASDEAEPFFGIPTLHHTPLSAERHSGSMTCWSLKQTSRGWETYLYGTHLTLSVIFNRVPAFFHLDFRCGGTLGSFAIHKGNRLANVGFIISPKRSLVEKGTAKGYNDQLHVIEEKKSWSSNPRYAYSASPFVRPIKPKPLSAFQRCYIQFISLRLSTK